MVSQIRLTALAYLAATASMAAEQGGMIRHLFILKPAMALNQYDDWYSKVHSQECLRYFGPWLRRYDMYWGKPAGDTGNHNVYPNGRYLELWYDSVEAWREASPLTHPYSAPPGGSMNNPEHPTASVIVPANPTENLLGKEPPPQQGPYFRWVVALKYPKGVDPEAADKWYREVHMQQAKNLPGLVRYVSYKALEHSPAPSEWKRITELWYKDYDAWRNATFNPPFKYMPPAWAQPNQAWFDTVSIFVTNEPDVDFLSGRRKQ